MRCDIFLPLFSRDAINHPLKQNQNFMKLQSSSPCDNVLLEHQLALEFKERGLIANIYPVLIGQVKIEDGETIHSRFTRDGSAPAFMDPEVFVESVNKAVVQHLDRLALGTPLLPELSVAETYRKMMKYQAFYLEGNFAAKFTELIQHVKGIKSTLEAQQQQTQQEYSHTIGHPENLLAQSDTIKLEVSTLQSYKHENTDATKREGDNSVWRYWILSSLMIL